MAMWAGEMDRNHEETQMQADSPCPLFAPMALLGAQSAGGGGEEGGEEEQQHLPGGEVR